MVRMSIYTSDMLMRARRGELQGYELVAIVEDEMPIDVPDESKEKNPYNGQQPTKKVVTKRSLFVFEQCETAALDQAEDAQHYAEDTVAQLTTKNAELAQKLSTEVEPLKRQVSDLMVEKDRALARAEDSRQAAITERETRRVLEEDLSRVRKAIGDLRWNEIVKGTTR